MTLWLISMQNIHQVSAQGVVLSRYSLKVLKQVAVGINDISALETFWGFHGRSLIIPQAFNRPTSNLNMGKPSTFFDVGLTPNADC